MRDISSVTSRDHKPLRVLHVLEATLGGTLRYMQNIADATDGSTMVCAFAYGEARADSRLIPFLEAIGLTGWKTYPIAMHREIGLLRDVKAFLQLRSAILHFRPDVLHCHSSKAGALGRAVPVWRNPPVRLYSPHAVAAPLGIGYLRIERALARLTDHFIAVSESERLEIVGHDLASGGGITVVYPSIDIGHFTPISRAVARRSLGLDAAPLIVAIGRLTAQKDPLAFIRIIKCLNTLRPDARAIWVGSGSGNLDVQAAIKAAGMEDVISLAPWQHDVRMYIGACDVLLSTSAFESFGYVAAEALAMSRPVVATDVTGTSDIMTGPLKQWLYPVGDHAAAALLLDRLLGDPGLGDRVGSWGRSEICTRFTNKLMQTSLLSAYEAAAQSRVTQSH